MVGYDDVSNLSLEIIKMLNENGIPCSVLTKGILPFQLTQLSKRNEYGITLVSLDEEFRTRFEPNTASFQTRIQALRELHNEGCYTWVSIEPYPTPNIIEQDLTTLLDSIAFVDKIIFGRMHYNKTVTAYKQHKTFYNNCAETVINFCNSNGITYHIKNGTITKS